MKLQAIKNLLIDTLTSVEPLYVNRNDVEYIYTEKKNIKLTISPNNEDKPQIISEAYVMEIKKEIMHIEIFVAGSPDKAAFILGEHNANEFTFTVIK